MVKMLQMLHMVEIGSLWARKTAHTTIWSKTMASINEQLNQWVQCGPRGLGLGVRAAKCGEAAGKERAPRTRERQTIEQKKSKSAARVFLCLLRDASKSPPNVI